MDSAERNFSNVDGYIASFDEALQIELQAVRSLILKTIPEATECISYQIPCYKINGNVIFFAGFKNHYSIYPVPRSNAKFTQALQAYKGGPGTMQMRYGQKLPKALLKKIIKHNLEVLTKKLKK
jgi:uncharacterized protein YdhG (YjbR/CyaY superfamily)